MSDQPQDAPTEEHEFDFEIMIAMLGLLGDDLVSALELDEVTNRELINEWFRVYKEAPRTQEGSETLEKLLDQMWAQVQKIDERGLGPAQLAALAYAVHGWEQAARENNPAPFGDFDEEPLD